MLKILSGKSDKNIPFDELCSFLSGLGFSHRNTGGSHRIFYKDGIEEIINIQPIGGKAKSYQVKKTRELIIKYRLGGSIDV
jgi:predicted RNA binding protein YcfA (HicA-like mRNA interferase family)